MLADFPKFRSLMREFCEKIARIFIGEPARIVRKSEWDRLERLAYREQLRKAEEDGDNEFIEQQIRKNQLTTSDLNRLSRKRTPIEEWPDIGDEIIAPTLFDGAEDEAHCAHA